MLKRRAKATRLRWYILIRLVLCDWTNQPNLAKLSAPELSQSRYLLHYLSSSVPSQFGPAWLISPTGHSVSCQSRRPNSNRARRSQRTWCQQKINTWFCFFYSDLWALWGKKPNPSPVKRSRNHFKSPFARSVLRTRSRFDLRIKMDVK